MVYAVAGWGLLQAADVLAPLAGLPDWILRVVLLALVLGFPVALLLGWMFQWTPAGIERDEGSSAQSFEPSQVEPGARMRRRLAVLPFRNVGGDDNNEYLAGGLTEELLSALSNVGALRIPADHPCCRCADGATDLREIASTLPVSHVIEGTVKSADELVDIETALSDAETGACIWSECFHRPRAELMHLGDDIAQQVTRVLGADVAGERRSRHRDYNPEAYTAFLKGRHALNRWTAAGCREAVEHFEEALAAEPSMARAHAGISHAYWWLASYGSLSPDEGFPRARAAAERALALDHELAEAYLALAQVKLGYEWDFDGAEAAFRRALALEPTNAQICSSYGHFLQMVGRDEEAVKMRGEAVRLDPLSLRAHLGLADSLFCAGAPRSALRELDKITELDPDYPVHHLRARIELARGHPREALDAIGKDPLGWRRLYVGAIAYHRLGQTALARARLSELVDAHGDSAALQIALVHSQMNENDEALRWLEKAYRQRDPGLIELRADPELEPLRSEDRFRSLERRVGFPAREGVATA